MITGLRQLKNFCLKVGRDHLLILRNILGNVPTFFFFQVNKVNFQFSVRKSIDDFACVPL